MGGRLDFDNTCSLLKKLAVLTVVILVAEPAFPQTTISSSADNPATIAASHSNAKVPLDPNSGSGQSPTSASISSNQDDDASTSANVIDNKGSYNGAFTRRIPIRVPRYFGIGPDLALTYDSSRLRTLADDGFGPVGVGWSVGGGSVIQRMSEFAGTPNFNGSDLYALDGDRLIDCSANGLNANPAAVSCAGGGTHTTRFERFQKIERINQSGAISWRVTGRQGMQRTYLPVGTWNNSGSIDVRLREKYRWLLAEVKDVNGNKVTYSYNCNASPNCYISTISYGPNTTRFRWIDRPDDTSVANGISVATINKRLGSIEVKQSGSRIRVYALTYIQSPDTDRSLLRKIQEFGSDAVIQNGVVTGGTGLRRNRFNYWNMQDYRSGTMISDLVTANSDPESIPYSTATEANSPLSAYEGLNYDKWISGDFDGDGKDDALYMRQNPSDCSARFFKSGQLQGGGPNDPTLTSIPAVKHDGTNARYFCLSAESIRVADIDADGTDDLVMLGNSDKFDYWTTNCENFGRTGEGTNCNNSSLVGVLFMKNGNVRENYLFRPKTYTTSVRPFLVGEFNGNGNADIYMRKLYTWNGGGFDENNWANAGVGKPGDFNNDGLMDLFELDGVNGTNSRLLLSNGSGFDAKPLGMTLTDRSDFGWDSPVDNQAKQLGFWFSGDLNGDGTTDLAQCARDRVQLRSIYTVLLSLQRLRSVTRDG